MRGIAYYASWAALVFVQELIDAAVKNTAESNIYEIPYNINLLIH